MQPEYLPMNKLMLLLFILPLTVNAAMPDLPPDTAFVAVKDTSLMKKKVRSYSGNLTTLECAFVQKKSMSLFTKPVESGGFFFYRNGNQVRWEYTTPFHYLIIINDGKMTVRDESGESSFDLTAVESFAALSKRLSSFMKGDVVEEDGDFRRRYDENGLFYRIRMYPLAEDLKSYFSVIDVYFDKNNPGVARVVMRENNGDVTDIEFVNRKLNQTIPDSKFTTKS